MAPAGDGASAPGTSGKASKLKTKSIRRILEPPPAPAATASPATGSKSVKKPRFSLRGYDFVPLDVKADNLCTGGQEGTSALPSTRASQTVVAERLENVEEQAEDLAPEFALPTKKENTSVSELLDNL